MWPRKKNDKSKSDLDSNVEALPCEDDLRRLPPFRVIFLAAAWAQHARDFYEAGSEDIRAGVNRDELRQIDDAICIAKEIALDPTRWSAERVRADHRAATVQGLFRGTADSAEFQHDPLYWTRGGHERLDSKEWTSKGTYRDMLAKLVRSDVAGAAFFAVQAAGNGPFVGTYGRPIAYDAAAGAHLGLGHLACAARTMSSLRLASETKRAVDAIVTARRDYLRVRDLTQDYTVNGFLHEAKNDADAGDDWRLKLFGRSQAVLESAFHALPWPACVALTYRAVERVVEKLDAVRVGLDEIGDIYKLLERVRAAAEQPDAPVAQHTLPSWCTAKDGQQETYIALAALREAALAAKTPPRDQAAKPLALKAVLSCFEVALWQNEVREQAGRFFADLELLKARATRENWTDRTPVPPSVFREGGTT